MRRRFQSKSYDEINITPLMDTVFFLLIIFMITAPLLDTALMSPRRK
ncbi:MAG: biopolymer transporter ExbD [Victivallales bacterium]